MIISTIWGFAEATLFFIVPDVWLTQIAVRRGLIPALIACGFALGGALAGGALMYAWGAVDINSARDALDWVPSIDKGMIKDVRAALRDDDATAMIVGQLTGVPYKIYAVEASAAGVGLATFLSVSILARLMRFAGLAIVAWSISRLLERRVDTLTQTATLLVVWGVFYVFYLTVMPN